MSSEKVKLQNKSYQTKAPAATLSDKELVFSRERCVFTEQFRCVNGGNFLFNVSVHYVISRLPFKKVSKQINFLNYAFIDLFYVVFGNPFSSLTYFHRTPNW